ncbi:oligosaccharide flippase family protein [Novosphingobium sp. 9]|uniref:oligosaccharide flippase family protein n=1 Tax=Novosphingobium sp. 9 TaxID=2025349 RepID=UPI0021B513B5|nr:oligosaccharide flippase family protein [Novosphingobium sp. 9]
MKKHLQNFSYMFFVQVANYAFPLVTIPLVSRIFGPSNIGLINYVAAIVNYFALAVNYSFNYTGVRRLARGDTDAEKVFSAIFMSQVYIFSLCLVIFAAMTWMFDDLRNNMGLAWATFLTCLAMLFNQVWFLQAKGDFRTIALISFAAKAATFALILMVIRSPKDVVTYVLILNGAAVVSGLFGLIVVLRKYRIRLAIPPVSECLKMIGEDKILFFSAVSTSLYTSGGIVLLGAFAGVQEIGYYSSAQKLIDVIRTVALNPFFQILFPILSASVSRDREGALKVIRLYMPVFVLFSIGLLIGMLLFGKLMISVIFGQAFLPALPIFLVLSFGLIAVFYGLLVGGQVMLNLGYDRAFLNIQIVVSVASLIVNYFVLPRGGGMTTAIVWSTAEIVMSLSQVIFLKRAGVTLFERDAFRLASLRRLPGLLLRKGESHA